MSLSYGINRIAEARSGVDTAHLDSVLEQLEREGVGLAAKINSWMHAEHGRINRDTARQIVTEECPEGFIRLPVRKYENHEQGIAGFCRGEVLYYLADYDILKNKIDEIASCDAVLNRFTRSREVYGVYFRKDRVFVVDNATESSKGEQADSRLLVDVASFYADFNHFLLESMQGEVSPIESIFHDVFGVQQKTQELEQFFDSAKYMTE